MSWRIRYLITSQVKVWFSAIKTNDKKYKRTGQMEREQRRPTGKKHKTRNRCYFLRKQTANAANLQVLSFQKHC